MESFWTTSNIDQLLDLWNVQRKSSSEIAKILHITPVAVIAKLGRLRKSGVVVLHNRKKIIQNEDRKVRRCLRCRKDFLSESRFIRICKKCKVRNAEICEGAIRKFLT